MQLYTWPHGYPSAKSILLGGKDGQTVVQSLGRCSASELLSLAPALRAFATMLHGSPACPAGTQSLLLLCISVDLIFSAAARGMATPEKVEESILRHLVAHKSTYGIRLWKPKSHYVLHLCDQWSRHGLFNTFAPESKHQEPHLRSASVWLGGYGKGMVGMRGQDTGCGYAAGAKSSGPPPGPAG